MAAQPQTGPFIRGLLQLDNKPDMFTDPGSDPGENGIFGNRFCSHGRTLGQIWASRAGVDMRADGFSGVCRKKKP